MKKGFTLLELLSVIIILAVITLIAVPVISGIITKVRLNSLKSSAYGLMEASNIYHAQYENKKSVRFDIDKNKVSSSDTDKLLTYNGEVKEGTVIINKKGETSLCITDGKNSVYKNYRDKDVIAVANQKCTIPSSTYVVYLDNQATLNELSNQELTELVQSMQERIDALETNKANQTDLDTVATVAGSATLDKIYPVGSIYISTTDDTVAKVQARFGGTWEVYGDGRMIKSSTSAAGSTGGSNSVTLSANQIPSLSVSGTTGSTGSGYSIGYTYSNRTTNSSNFGTVWRQASTYGNINPGATSAANQADIASSSHSHTYSDYYVNSISGVAPHTHSITASYTNNSQASVDVENKYITVYMYKRTA